MSVDDDKVSGDDVVEKSKLLEVAKRASNYCSEFEKISQVVLQMLSVVVLVTRLVGRSLPLRYNFHILIIHII